MLDNTGLRFHLILKSPILRNALKFSQTRKSTASVFNILLFISRSKLSNKVIIIISKKRRETSWVLWKSIYENPMLAWMNFIWILLLYHKRHVSKLVECKPCSSDLRIFFTNYYFHYKLFDDYENQIHLYQFIIGHFTNGDFSKEYFGWNRSYIIEFPS